MRGGHGGPSRRGRAGPSPAGALPRGASSRREPSSRWGDPAGDLDAARRLGLGLRPPSRPAPPSPGDRGEVAHAQVENGGEHPVTGLHRLPRREPLDRLYHDWGGGDVEPEWPDEPADEALTALRIGL